MFHRELVKEEHFMIILGYFFLILHKYIHCGYSLEVPRWGTSNEYPHPTFIWRNKKNYPRIIAKYIISGPHSYLALLYKSTDRAISVTMVSASVKIFKRYIWKFILALMLDTGPKFYAVLS